MYNEYLDILCAISLLSSETKENLSFHISHKKIPKGENLLKKGQVCRHIYFVQKGFLRIYYYKDGKDITEWFTSEKSFCFSISSYFSGNPSQLIIEALEDSEVIMLSKNGLEEMQKTNLEIAHLMIQFFSGSLIASQKRMDSIQFESAKKRYERLLHDQPEIIHKVPLQNIASFLGITQETLSRIRARL